MSFVNTIQAICGEKGLPIELSHVFLGFCNDYEKACVKAGVFPDSCIETFTTFLQTVSLQLQKPYPFAAYHEAVRAPIDYYTLGLDFVRPLIDMAHSGVTGGLDVLQEIHENVSKQENVVLFSNHQTEIDPQVISILLEKSYPKLSENMLFVAGHRVTTDPLAVPLSLGRNLICIYSKRHMEKPPKQKAEKLAHNQKALRALTECLALGGQCVYIAPSGGRDRHTHLRKIEVAPFDPNSIEMFYLLAQKAKTPTHFYTLSLSSYALLPPPETVLSTIGEKRTTTFSPAHLFFGKKIDMEHAGECQKEIDKKKKRKIRSDAIYKQVVDDYNSFCHVL